MMGDLSDIVSAQRRRVFLSYRKATASSASAAVRDYLTDIGLAVSVFRFEDDPKQSASSIALRQELADEIASADHTLVVVGALEDLHAPWMCAELDLHQTVGRESAPAFLITAPCVHRVGTVPFAEVALIHHNMGEGTVLYDVYTFNFWIECLSRRPPEGVNPRHYFSDGVAPPGPIRGHALEKFFMLRAVMGENGKLQDAPFG